MSLIRYPQYFISMILKGSPYNLAKEIINGFLNKRNPVGENKDHIQAGIGWLLHAQKVNNDGGVSAFYSLYGGWQESYSETTGYIISTMFNYYHVTKDESIKKSALRMADWELTKQLPEGAFPGGAVDGKEFPIVFNTGQVIFGMVRCFEETQDEKYKNAAITAADWLVEVQDTDGCWRKNTYLNKIHTYNTRVAWSLLKVHSITKDEKYKNAAIKNIDWALSQQDDQGWFDCNTFHENQEPLLHTIAYSIRGILECGIYLDNKKFVEAATVSANALIKKIREDGSFAGSFDDSWDSSISWSCLTGNSQMSIIYLRLFKLSKDEKYLEAAKKINAYMKSTQNLSSKNPGIRGGIKGAYPIYGWYAPFSYINWAVKFFVDSLMLEEDADLGNKLS